jgi:hypothetical protein
VMRRLEWNKRLRDIHRLHKDGLPGKPKTDSAK